RICLSVGEPTPFATKPNQSPPPLPFQLILMECGSYRGANAERENMKVHLAVPAPGIGASCAATARRFRLSDKCAVLERAVPADERSFGSMPAGEHEADAALKIAATKTSTSLPQRANWTALRNQ